jgi:hypothetical protein
MTTPDIDQQTLRHDCTRDVFILVDGSRAHSPLAKRREYLM